MVRTKSKRFGLLSIGLFLTGLILLLIGLNKRVTLVIDGQSTTTRTFALTVGGLLDTLKISLAPEDIITPPVNTWVRDGMRITIQRTLPVQVLADGTLFNFISADRLPSNLLAEAGVALHPGDQLLSEGLPIAVDTPLSKSLQVVSLQIHRTLPFTLREGSQVNQLSSDMSGLGQALWKTGIILHTSDRLQPPPNSPITTSLEATLERAQMITISTSTGVFKVLTAAKTVGEALADAGLAIQGLDYAKPSAEQPIPTNHSIRLIRVQEEVIIGHTPLAFETAYEPDPDLELDSQSLLQAGEYGLTAQRIRIRYEDGEEISRQVEDEWVARQTKPRIVGYGTKIVKHSLDTADGTIYYYRALTMWATSYSPASVGGSTTTASGKTLRKGLVGINYHYIPFGTMMYVPGYGYAEAADTGNIGPRWIDLGYTDEDYVAWHQYVTVYFLWPPPDQILWIYP